MRVMREIVRVVKRQRRGRESFMMVIVVIVAVTMVVVMRFSDAGEGDKARRWEGWMEGKGREGVKGCQVCVR